MSAVQNNMPAQQIDVAAEAGKKQKRSLKKNVMPQEFGGPVKVPSGFFLFSTKHRPTVTENIRAGLKEGEKFNVSLVAGQLGKMWKETSEADKLVFNNQSKELKAKHDVDLEKWKMSADYKLFVKASALHSKKKADKKALVQAKSDGLPQRPMSGYFLFNNEIRDECRKELEAKGEKFSVMASAAITKEKWAALGEEGQKKYQDAYAVAKAKYAEEMKTWQETDAGKAFAKAKSTAAKRKQQNSRVGKKAKRVKKEKEGEESSPSESEEEVEEEDVDVAEEEGAEEEAGEE